uniref:PUM-HD domain-containing protein n=1 Tax=Sinocyclocheilus grahami TaxID=75366 RepID=A0A672S2S5_SINGR
NHLQFSMEARPRKKSFTPNVRDAKKPSFKPKGKPGGKPQGKRPFKPHSTDKGKTFKKSGGDGGPRKFNRKPADGKFAKKRKHPGGKEDGGSEGKKPKWGEFKQKKKELKQNRQQNEKKESYQIVSRAKQVWEIVRRKDCDKQKRAKLMKELQNLVKGKIKTIAFAHDSTRVLQCFIQFGNDQQRLEVFDELKEHIVELSKSKYARNIVKKFLMYGSKPQVGAVMSAFKGNVRQMLRHSEASSVVEYAYNDKAVLSQRLMLTEELYGNAFQVCKSSVCPTLEKVLEANPEKLEGIIDEMKQILTPMAQKEAVIKHSLVHKVFLDFFEHAPAKQRTVSAIEHFLSTHTAGPLHGSRRHVSTVALNGQTALHGAFPHFVVLVNKTLTQHFFVLFCSQEMVSSLSEVISNKYGKKVLLYMLSPRDPAHFLPEIIQVLKKGDGNAHSKKDVAIRRTELLEAVSPPLLKYLCENAPSMVMDKACSVAVRDILGAAIGDLRPAMEAVAALAAQPLIPGGEDGQLHMAEHPAGHLVLKWLIEQDAKMKEAEREERFSRILLEKVGLENLKTWASVNRGAIVLCCLLQSADESVAEEVKVMLKSILPELQKVQNSKGVEVLLEKLA